MTSKRFCDVPIGTRFVFNHNMWLKIAADAAQCVGVCAFQGRVHSLASDCEVWTA
jgi:hypothetical protein